MDNYAVADHFTLLSKLMDIHGENSFKSKSYANTAFQIERLSLPLATMDEAQMASQKGIGSSAAAKITELLKTGQLKALQELIENTPPGVMDMLQIKGLGPKKIQVVWKEMQLESIGELLYACQENRLLLYKGFGAKTQQNIQQSIEFYLQHQGYFLYQQVEDFIETLLKEIKAVLPEQTLLSVTGEARRCCEVIQQIDFLAQCSADSWNAAAGKLAWPKPEPNSSETLLYYKLDGLPVLKVQLVSEKDAWGTELFLATGPEAFTAAVLGDAIEGWSNEEDLFTAKSYSYIRPIYRDHPQITTLEKDGKLADIITEESVKGIIHTHSNWSDGGDTIRTMATRAKEDGFEYLVISDHSRTAVYANGLTIDRVLEQHAEIDVLNSELHPFKIFKSIESDILNDGSLDYPPEILARFDLVIGSVHSNLKMSEDKAMQRLLNAIANPYLTILGHPTGRLLLSRAGYPLNHETLIAACVANKVVIELNAHPRRLDIDWRLIQKAVNAGAMISINPDAHAADAFTDIHYGVLAAQKGLLPASFNLSSLTLAGFETFLQELRLFRGNHW